ncbi:MAG TPA: ABC transporter ATP-binding protein [Acidimicrobiales bacterium]|nr:ABC transporter ATP-binding protein [Acidimicrobiales bacterium]
MTDTDARGTTLAFEHVSVRFGGLLALNDVTFGVPECQIVGLIGPNGAGKTTAFNVACGFQRPTSGAVSFPELHRRGLHPSQLAKAGVARTLQGVGLFNHMSVLENVMAGAQSRPGGGVWTSLLGLPMGLRHERAIRDEAMGQLERLGVARYAAALPSGIPYGIAKKVSIARALMEQPALLMLDEPASGLDESELEVFTSLIVELRQSMSVLLVEHNMDFVMQLVDVLVVLNFGEVIAQGTPGEISHNPDVLAAYLGIDE